MTDNPTNSFSEEWLDAFWEEYGLENWSFKKEASAAILKRHKEELNRAKFTIKTSCPSCKHTSLIISADNWLVCGNLECNDPAAINAVKPSKEELVAARIDELTSLQHYGSPTQSYVKYSEVEQRIKQLQAESKDRETS